MEEDHTSRTFAELSRFVYKSPHWRILSVPIFVIFLIDYLLVRDLPLALVGIVGSFLLLLLIDWIFVRIAGFVFPFRRILFMDFVSLVIWTIFFWIIFFIGFAGSEYLLMLAISSVSFVRVIILFGYYSESGYRTVLPSMNYTFAAIIMLFPIYMDPISIAPFLISSFVYSIAGAAFVKRSTRKFSEEFDESPTEMIKFFLNYKTSGGSEKVGQKFFDKIYRHNRKVPVKAMDIQSMDGKRKVLAVFPYIHPGPFGNLGSSNLPERLQQRLEEVESDLMVFHTTTTNSNNCRGDRDMDSIAEGIRKCLDKMEYTEHMSKFKKINVGKYSVSMQRIGDFACAALIPERAPFDDVNLSEGLKVINSLKDDGLTDLALIDAQNNFRDGVRELKDCSPFIPALRREMPRMQNKYPARIGYSRMGGTFEGLAVMGVQALVFNTGESYQAIVLTDSNNVTAEVIEMAREKTASVVDGLELYTSDNHAVNGGSLDMNPLGLKCDVDKLTDLIYSAVEKAKNDVENVRVGMASETVNVQMGDENSFQELINIVFSSFKTAKYTIALTVPLAIFLSLALFRVFMMFY